MKKGFLFNLSESLDELEKLEFWIVEGEEKHVSYFGMTINDEK